MSVILSKVRAGVWNHHGGAGGSAAGGSVTGSEEEFDETLECGDRILLTHSVLDEAAALRFVRDDGAGASVLFVGTTRNEFGGKSVRRLEYTAYSSMARKMMRKVLSQQRRRVEDESGDSIKRIYLAHRLGSVDTAQPSILVCVSSAHRKASFAACEDILEEVKRCVPIWKKEVYAGEHEGEAEWKANSKKHWAAAATAKAEK